MYSKRGAREEIAALGLIMELGSLIRLLITVAISCFLMTTSATASELTSDLARIFCEEMAIRGGQPGHWASVNSEWQQFAKRLESKQPRFENLPASFSMQDCVQEHSAEFAVGEFILEGKALLEKNLVDLATTARETGIDMVSADTRMVNAETVGTVTIALDKESPSSSGAVFQMETRRDHYKQLWGDFLDGLRKKYSLRLTRR